MQPIVITMFIQSIFEIITGCSCWATNALTVADVGHSQKDHCYCSGIRRPAVTLDRRADVRQNVPAPSLGRGELL